MPHGTLTIPTSRCRSGVEPASLGRWTDPLGRQAGRGRSPWRPGRLLLHGRDLGLVVGQLLPRSPPKGRLGGIGNLLELPAGVPDPTIGVLEPGGGPLHRLVGLADQPLGRGEVVADARAASLPLGLVTGWVRPRSSPSPAPPPLVRVTDLVP
jgi:hypothetical protein